MSSMDMRTLPGYLMVSLWFESLPDKENPVSFPCPTYVVRNISHNIIYHEMPQQLHNSDTLAS